MIPTRIVERRSMRGLSQSTHVSYIADDNTHKFQEMVILNGSDMTLSHGEPYPLLISTPDLWVKRFPTLATHVREDISIISYMSLAGRWAVRLLKRTPDSSNTPLSYRPAMKEQDFMELSEFGSVVHDLHPDSILTLSGLSQIDLETGKIHFTQTKNVLSLLEDMPPSLTYSSIYPVELGKNFMLSMTPHVKMLTTIKRDTLAITDFRDCNNTASDWVCRTDGTERCQGYTAGVKAHCKAVLCTGLGALVSVDRGVINTRNIWIPDSPESSRRWEPPQVIAAGEIPVYARRPSLAYYLRGEGRIRDLHALSDVSPVVAVIGKNRSTRLYDVKREEMLAYVSQDYIHDAVPVFCDGFPQLVGINRSTHKLEIVA